MSSFFASATLVTAFVVSTLEAVSYGPEQSISVWEALRINRGNQDLTVEQIQEIIRNAVPDKDYPVGPTHPPDLPFDCSSFQFPGYYVDYTPASRCQVFHRCDLEGVRTSYICPNMTLFNQITLVCDWFFNVADCRGQQAFDYYSNGRLSLQDQLLFDEPLSPQPELSKRELELPQVLPVITEPKFFKCDTNRQCSEIEAPSQTLVKKDGIKIDVSRAAPL